MKKSVLGIFLALAMCFSLFAFAVPQTASAESFSDVSEGSYCYDAVCWAVSKDITKGTGASLFSPNMPCTRAQAVTFIWRAEGCPEATLTANPFTDVSAKSFCYDAVLWAAETGITTGTSATAFSPNKTCTRGEIVTFLWRSQGCPAPESAECPFTDVPENAYYRDAVLWATEQGITLGTTDTTFSPDKTCTRGQIVTLLYRMQQLQKQGCAPVFNGTFLQSWYSCTWDDARWQAEIAAMQQAGIKYLILQDTAEKASRTDGGKWTVYYDSELDTFSDAAFSDADVIEAALRNCSGSGIQVFIGLSMFDDFWTEGANTSQYKDVCRVAAAMAKEIYAKYHADYADAFGGWYFPPELNNMPICQLNILGICSGINILIDTLNELDASLPLMLSPFNSDYLSLGSSAASFDWKQFFRHTNLRDGDIFAPQDAVGAGWTKEENLRRNWEMYRKAVDSAEADVQLWANCENFITNIEDSFGSGVITRPATENTESVTATLDRFVNQLKIASEYCDNIITFSYNHYFSPYAVSSVYMDTYLDYVAKGYVLESNAPGEITNCYKGQYDANVLITWDEPEDDFGIAYYKIFKDGTFLTRIECCYGLDYTQFYDWNADVSAEYSIIAYDAAGNASPAAIAQG
ncbi:MAG: DUF4434 domain-containing protein [Bacillota bacterium]|nr:DUF4434 domain-containing protein [Bacillota bacterium]